MQFEFYVINYNINKRKTEMFNIFQNCMVQKYTEKEIKKYLRSPRKYKYETFSKEVTYGFEGLCKHIDSIIAWQERGRCEYEISAGNKFEDNCNNLNSWDCYEQAHANIETIVRDCIHQFKSQKKQE